MPVLSPVVVVKSNAGRPISRIFSLPFFSKEENLQNFLFLDVIDEICEKERERKKIARKEKSSQEGSNPPLRGTCMNLLYLHYLLIAFGVVSVRVSNATADDEESDSECPALIPFFFPHIMPRYIVKTYTYYCTARQRKSGLMKFRLEGKTVGRECRTVLQSA